MSQPAAATPSPADARSGRLRRAAQLALVLAGLAVMAFGAVRLAHPQITCRGVTMHAGDVCHKNGFGELGTDQVQTYEQRLHAYRLSQPVVVAVGALTAGFGAALYRQERRRQQ